LLQLRCRPSRWGRSSSKPLAGPVGRPAMPPRRWTYGQHRALNGASADSAAPSPGGSRSSGPAGEWLVCAIMVAAPLTAAHAGAEADAPSPAPGGGPPARATAAASQEKRAGCQVPLSHQPVRVGGEQPGRQRRIRQGGPFRRPHQLRPGPPAARGSGSRRP